jgi:mRNA interferase RelE/StbE
MKTEFRKSFIKDIKRLGKDKKLLGRIRDIILEVEAAGSITTIANLKKLKAEGTYYRIRSGNYRLGLIIEHETVVFVRVLHRSEIYRYFP